MQAKRESFTSLCTERLDGARENDQSQMMLNLIIIEGNTLNGIELDYDSMLEQVAIFYW